MKEMREIRVLYMVHSIPKFDTSGTPYAAWRMAKLAQTLHGVKAAFLIGSPDNIVQREVIEGITVYMLPTIPMQENFFLDCDADREQYLSWVDSVIRDFNPTILHVYNFIGFSYQLLRLKTLHSELKILRTVTHTEDVCFGIDPLYFYPDGKVTPCPGPFPIERCARHFAGTSGNNVETVKPCLAKHYQQLNAYYQKLVDGVIFSGHGFHDFMAKIFTFPAKRWFIPYGIASAGDRQDASESASVGRPLTMTFFGGVGPRKGLGVLLQAIRMRPEILRSVRIRVTGKTADTAIFRDLQKLQAQYPGRIEVLGQLTDAELDLAMRHTDVALLPSYFETYNITLRELLLRGTPSIVADTFGTEIITQGVNGFIIPIGDASALLEVMLKLVRQPKWLTRLREGAIRTPVETLESECRNIVEVYRELLGAAGSGRNHS